MTAADNARLDVPLAELLAALRPGCLAEQAHQMDALDAAFARLACEHGDRCSTADTYPDWTPGKAA
ncbi:MULTISPECIES: hypothetical protein [Streptomyces]|uniref:Uncharacterized protein n=1 Tax=Streptomyces venezuelae (strain ATCC 10712 / CBS 650.69 / DSM 40230 / JCM 4526 / NBRC 13096 / PD 04745) TaxID=953739 RepID=F2RKX3_STRVP|nr:hypothetical protein [Streptomyces venezuelae]APE21344.1 hypothetical protein vnz_10150 [Streptomyces venezuelae]QER98733.1 hypothetical protein DEJ43_10275 [Streptomyces venezuelae ATCC 10712]CCA55362.1 hypothetical protein SVEN_2076 [Streptomyces venezuelae ATCC 10712]